MEQLLIRKETNNSNLPSLDSGNWLTRSRQSIEDDPDTTFWAARPNLSECEQSSGSHVLGNLNFSGSQLEN